LLLLNEVKFNADLSRCMKLASLCIGLFCGTFMYTCIKDSIFFVFCYVRFDIILVIPYTVYAGNMGHIYTLNKLNSADFGRKG